MQWWYWRKRQWFVAHPEGSANICNCTNITFSHTLFIFTWKRCWRAKEHKRLMSFFQSKRVRGCPIPLQSLGQSAACRYLSLDVSRRWIILDVCSESICAPWVCHELRTQHCEPGTQGGCSQVEEPNLSQQAPKQLCKCMNRDNISIMRPVLYHQSLQKGLKPDLPPSTDSASVIAPHY